MDDTWEGRGVGGGERTDTWMKYRKCEGPNVWSEIITEAKDVFI